LDIISQSFTSFVKPPIFVVATAYAYTSVRTWIFLELEKRASNRFQN
jgi:hypothetical protein